MFFLAVRDSFENTVVSSEVGNFAARLLAPGFPAVHASFVPRESDIVASITPYRASTNVSFVFDVLEQGLQATMYSDSSFRSVIRSSDVKSIDFLIDSVLFPSDFFTSGPQNVYGFRWLGFFKPQQVGTW
jgi:hypothetical protein